MSLSERLQLIIEASATGAISAFEKTGTVAEKELLKADTMIDKVSTRMTKFGASTLAAAGVAGFALMKLASSYEEDVKTELKLENSLANSTRAAGASKQSFIDLAMAMEKKTVIDHDQIVSAEALLLQYGLTGDQVKQLTPLVADLSRKMGIDLETAARAIGKAIETQSTTALKRMGIVLDETGIKTNAFGTIFDGLKAKVGGFAEKEGATFSGRLESLKNQVKSLGEDVGKGVVDSLQGVTSGLSSVVGGLQKISPEALQAFGGFMTNGVLIAGAVGGFSLLGGQLLKLKDRLIQTGADGSRSLTALGTGSVVAFAAIGALTMIMSDAQDQARLMADGQNALAQALQNTGGSAADAASRSFLDLMNTSTDLQKVWAQSGLSTQDLINAFNGVPGASRKVYVALGEIANSNHSLIFGYNDTGDAAVKLQDRFTGLSGALSATKNATDGATGSTAQLGPTAKEAANALAEETKALENQAAALDKAQTSGMSYDNALISLNDANQAVTDAINGTSSATSSGGGASQTAAEAANEHAKKLLAVTDAEHSLEAATQTLADAQRSYDDIIHGVAADSQAAADATRALTDAQNAATLSTLDVADAEDRLYSAQQAAAKGGATPRETAKLLRDVQRAQIALQQAQENSTDAQKKAAEQGDQTNGILNGFTDSSTTAKKAADALEAAHRGVTQAQLAQFDAIDQLTAKQTAGGAAAETAAEKQKKLEDAFRKQEKAMYDAATQAGLKAKADAEAAGIAEGKPLDAQTALKIQYEAQSKFLEDAAKKLDPSSPFRAALTGFIADWDKISGRISQTAQDSEITRHQSNATVDPQLQQTYRGAAASGGSGGPGDVFTVGEHGVELFAPKTAGSIIPISSGGGGGNSYSIVVNIGPGGNPVDAGKAVVEAIKAYERQAGKGWRSS